MVHMYHTCLFVLFDEVGITDSVASLFNTVELFRNKLRCKKCIYKSN